MKINWSFYNRTKGRKIRIPSFDHQPLKGVNKSVCVKDKLLFNNAWGWVLFTQQYHTNYKHLHATVKWYLSASSNIKCCLLGLIKPEFFVSYEPAVSEDKQYHTCTSPSFILICNLQDHDFQSMNTVLGETSNVKKGHCEDVLLRSCNR